MARAEERMRMKTIDIEFEHSLAETRAARNVNIMGSQTQRDVDLWPQTISRESGVYWGPLLPASSAALPVNSIVSLRLNISISTDDLAGGASGFWIRVPFDGSTVSGFKLSIDGCPQTTFPEVYYTVSWEDDEPLFWSFENYGNAEKIVWDRHGIFVRLDTIFSTRWKFADSIYGAGTFPVGAWEELYGESHENFIIDIVDVTPFDGGRVVMLLSEEEYVESFDLYFAPQYYGVAGTYFKKEMLATPAISFLFFRGLPNSGCFSVPWKPEDQYERLNTLVFSKISHVDNVLGKYVTFSIPFVGVSAWDVLIEAYDVTGGLAYYSQAFTTDTVENVLTISSAGILTAGPTWYVVYVHLRPHEEVVLLAGLDQFAQLNYARLVGGQIDYHERSRVHDYDYFSSDFGEYTVDSSTGFDVVLVPTEDMVDTAFVASISFSDGVYALVDWSGDITIVDFIWGQGAIYPGTMTIMLEIDGGGSMVYRSNVENLYGGIIPKGELARLSLSRGESPDTGEVLYSDDYEQVRVWIAPYVDPELVAEYYNVTLDNDEETDMSFVQAIMYNLRSMGVSLWDGIKGVFSTLWNYMTAAFDWLSNFLVNLAGKIVAFLKEVVGFISAILGSMIYILPPTLVMVALVFVASPEGAMRTVRRSVKKIKGAGGLAERKLVSHYKDKESRAREKEALYRRKIREKEQEVDK